MGKSDAEEVSILHGSREQDQTLPLESEAAAAVWLALYIRAQQCLSHSTPHWDPEFALSGTRTKVLSF